MWTLGEEEQPGGLWEGLRALMLMSGLMARVRDRARLWILTSYLRKLSGSLLCLYFIYDFCWECWLRTVSNVGTTQSTRNVGRATVCFGRGGCQHHRVLTLWKIAITPGRTRGGKCLHFLSPLTSPWFLRTFCGSNNPLGPEMMTHHEMNCLPCHQPQHPQALPH